MDKDTYVMVRRESDQMIVKMYVVPKELPGDIFVKVVSDTSEKIHQVYPMKDYTLLIGIAHSPIDFLKTFPDWAKGATTFEVEKLTDSQEQKYE
ncbi:hypothetical protein FJZ31_17635 [Candidatus Poribacteria bacterium]|nr:hypothetical protein [Candidatus Poribacteria bacterium]